MQAQRAEGTKDLIGRDMRAWQKMQDVAAEVFGPFGFEPVETPAIEQLDVFVHGIGQSTDVVRKEMFRVFSGANFERVLQEGTDAKLKAKQRLALRPEGTAGVVRAVVENNLVPQGAAPVKLYYAEAMFRGERPQKGRLRQFHQVGIEWLGAPDPAADAECIIMLMRFYERLGFDLSKLRLLINSMGDPACRPAYRDKVRQFILDHADEMCDECRERAELNPLRAFDCKNEHCHQVMADAPLMPEHLCDDCRDHYAKVKQYLDANIYGILNSGGTLPNIIPDYASLRYYIRCDQEWKTRRAVERINRCVQGAADSMGAELKITQYLCPTQPLLLNEPLLDAYETNMAALGEPVVVEEANRLSTDAGNVSFRIPTLHGMLGIHGCGGVDLHTEEFAARTVTEEGREATRLGVCALAGVGYDLLTRPELLEAVRADFQRGIREQDEKGVSSSCY